MTPKWLLQTDIFDENLEPLISEIKRQGMELKIHKYVPFYGDKTYLELFKPDDCVIFYGSLNFAGQILKQASWIPGVYRDLDKLKCSYYYPVFGDFLLNEDYIFLPFGDLKRRKRELFSYIFNADKIFVRPDSGFKSFTGQAVSERDWDKEIDFFKTHGIDDNELCLLSSPKKIVKEYRLVIVNNEVVSGSMYKKDWKNETGPVSPEVLDYAKKVLNTIDFKMEPYTMDVAEYGPYLSVIEINSFSCSGLYDCLLPQIVESVSKKALKDWESVYEIM